MSVSAFLSTDVNARILSAYRPARQSQFPVVPFCGGGWGLGGEGGGGWRGEAGAGWVGGGALQWQGTCETISPYTCRVTCKEQVLLRSKAAARMTGIWKK